MIDQYIAKKYITDKIVDILTKYQIEHSVNDVWHTTTVYIGLASFRRIIAVSVRGSKHQLNCQHEFEFDLCGENIDDLEKHVCEFFII